MYQILTVQPIPTPIHPQRDSSKFIGIFSHWSSLIMESIKQIINYPVHLVCIKMVDYYIQDLRRARCARIVPNPYHNSFNHNFQARMATR